MVDDTSSSETKSKTNKGVNVRSLDSYPAGVHVGNTVDTETGTTTNRSGNESIFHVKYDIQTTLDMMGPSTPILDKYDGTSEADNEESTVSENRSKSSSAKTCTTKQTATRSFTPTIKNTINDSLAADLATSSSCSNIESLIECVKPCQCKQLQQQQPQFCMNPDCKCMVGFMNQTIPIVPRQSCNRMSHQHLSCRQSTKPETTTTDNKKQTLVQWLKERSSEILLPKKQACPPCDLYKVNISKNKSKKDDLCLPKRLVFDLVEGIPTEKTLSVSTLHVKNPVEKRKSNFTSPRSKKTTYSKENEQVTRNLTYEDDDPTGGGTKDAVQRHGFFDSNGDTRVDFYYFDHGNAEYFHTTDTPPVMMCEFIAEKTERYTTRFWAEFFTTVHIGVAFVVSFALQLFKFLLYSVLRPLTVGLMQLGSDYFFKPFLTTLFNGILQPILIFMYNIATSLRDLCDPIAEGVGYFCRELAVLCRSIRLFSYTRCAGDKSNCKCNSDKKNKC